MALALVHALALHGIDYTNIKCEYERTLHMACDIVKPSPLSAPEDYDTCLRHEMHCHIRMLD